MCVFHSALKLEKKVQFQKYKNTFWQKINFCTRKKFKTTKNAILNFILVQKLIFAIFEIVKNVFLYF